MPKRNETLSFTTSFMGTNRASASTTIVDTSYPMTYTSKWATTAAGTTTITETDEGKDVYFVIDSDNVPDGTRGRVIIVSLGNSDTAAGVADFDDYVYSTDVVMSGGKAAVKVSIKADQLTENRESFYAALLNPEGGVLTHASLYINDTSKTPAPTYTAAWYSSSAGTTQINSINEGSTAWLIVKTTSINDNHGLLVKLSGAAANFGDISGQITDTMESSVNIINGIGRLSVSINADNLTEGVESLTASIFDGGVLRASAALTINDTSTETVITIPNEYNAKGVILIELFKKLMGRLPTSAENIRVVVPSNIELQGFPRVVGREWIAQKQYENSGLWYSVYKDTIWPACHALSLDGMPDTNKVLVDVYGKLISGPKDIMHGNNDPKVRDITFYPSGLPLNYYGRHSSGYYHCLVVGENWSQGGGFLDLSSALPYSEQYGYALYSSSGFKLIVRDSGMVLGHGGHTKYPTGVEADWLNPNTMVTDVSRVHLGHSAIKCSNWDAAVKTKIIGNGKLAGGGGAGGAGGGLLAIGSTHELSLAIYYGACGGGGAPYGGCAYTFYGNSGDPVSPTRYARTGTFTAGRRLGDTGSTGYRSKLSAASASLTTPGAATGRYQYGPDGKGYHFDYQPASGGNYGVNGNRGTTYTYVDYRWVNNSRNYYTETEKLSASVPGGAGLSIVQGAIITDNDLQ